MLFKHTVRCTHLIALLGLLALLGCDQMPTSSSPPKNPSEPSTPSSPSQTPTPQNSSNTSSPKQDPQTPTPESTKTRPTSRTETFRDLILAKTLEQKTFKTQVQSFFIDHTTGPSLTARNTKGIALKIIGSIENTSSKTLIDGALTPVLVLHFGAETVKVAIGPDALSPPVSANSPWRSGETRAIEGKTFVLPSVLAEYQPTHTEVALIASFQDPIAYKTTSLVWAMDAKWLSVRGVPVKGTAKTTRTELLRGGLRGAAVGRVLPDEVVELLYQQGDAFRVQANDGIGWVSSNALQLTSPDVYTNARPYGGSLTAEDEHASIKIHSLATLNKAPEGIRLDAGERLLIADIQISNKGDKDMKCSDFFVDYGPRRQLGVVRGNEVFSDALQCERGMLAAGQKLRGKVAFVRDRLDIPFSIGFATPARTPLMVDVYDPKDTAAWTKP